MRNKIIVFEEIYNYTRPMIKYYLLRGFKIFYYRINSSCKEKLWLKKYIKSHYLLKIDDKYNILSSSIGFYPDLAYENVDKIADFLMADDEIIRRLINLYGDERVYDIFKKSLISELHRFYYINYILYRLNELFPDKKIYFVHVLSKELYRTYIIDVEEYYKLKDLISKSEAFCYENKNIIFPLWFIILCRIHDWKRFLTIQTKIAVFIILSIIFSFLNKLKNDNLIKKSYKFGITIVSPVRQFANRIQKVDFLIDEEQIKNCNTLFICWKILPQQNSYYMKQNNLNFVDGLFNGINFKATKKILPFALYLFAEVFRYRKKIFVIESALLQLACFAIWSSFKEKYHIENLISHCDFGPQSIARNLLLTKENVKTWYYIDGMSWNNFFFFDEKRGNISKYNHAIGFLTYDYVLSWSNELNKYFKIHHQNIRNYINIGCLWAEHIKEIERGKIKSDFKERVFKLGFKDDYKLITVFDSTYFDNSITTYEDGINFLKGICRLLDDIPNVFIVFKEKKTRDFVKRYSREMIHFLNEMEKHPRCYLPFSRMNSSESIAFSDLTISFPFTSTTFEALSARKRALYYDASDKFRDTFYDKIPGLVCHSYDELLKRTKELLFNVDDVEYNKYLDEFVRGKVELYLDGNAISRFRELLTNSNYLQEQAVEMSKVR